MYTVTNTYSFTGNHLNSHLRSLVEVNQAIL